MTYQTRDKHGLKEEYLYDLIDKMAKNNMNLLSIMMISYRFYDEMHDGYAWPVRNKRLMSYIDATAVNANENTEYLKRVIEYAGTKNVYINLMMNASLWSEKIQLGYPDTFLQIDKDNKPCGCTFCPDSPDTRQILFDEIQDLLAYYSHENIISYIFERISYQSTEYCFCDHTKERFMKDTGTHMEKAPQEYINEWKNNRIGLLIKEYVKHIKDLDRNIDVWLHTSLSPGWGHNLKLLNNAGVSMYSCHAAHSKETKETLYDKFIRFDNSDIIPHVCVRDKKFRNYDIWEKSPDDIDWIIRTISNYTGDNLKGLLFFNENVLSETNKDAVYKAVNNYIGI